MSSAATGARERFKAAGVRALAMTMVDNGGITRVKAVPIGRLERVAARRRRDGLHLGRGRHGRPVRRRGPVRQSERRHAPDPRSRRRPRADRGAGLGVGAGRPDEPGARARARLPAQRAQAGRRGGRGRRPRAAGHLRDRGDAARRRRPPGPHRTGLQHARSLADRCVPARPGLGPRGVERRGRAVPPRIRARPVRGLDRPPRPARCRRRSRLRAHPDAIRRPPPRLGGELRADRLPRRGGKRLPPAPERLARRAQPDAGRRPGRRSHGRRRGGARGRRHGAAGASGRARPQPGRLRPPPAPPLGGRVRLLGGREP